MSSIGVFPDAGKLGTRIYTHLLGFSDPARAILSSRNTRKIASELTKAGAIMRKVDYDEAASLRTAFDNVEFLILISYPSLEFEHRVEAR